MCTRFVLHGDTGRESELARLVLESAGFPYRFEGGADPEDAPTLVTPAGRFRGLAVIRGMFGEKKPEVARR
jgi:hypothetical protein